MRIIREPLTAKKAFLVPFDHFFLKKCSYVWKRVFDPFPKKASQEWVFKLISFVMPQNFVNMVILVWRLMPDKDGKSKIWAMSRYMRPSFLKHLIDITSFILISVHNFHQIFHLKIYIWLFRYRWFQLEKRITSILNFNVLLLKIFPFDLFHPI